MVKISIDDDEIKICYTCYFRLCARADIDNITMYEGRDVVISADYECELCNKSNDIKINIDE